MASTPVSAGLPDTADAPRIEAPLARRALAGFFLSGLLFSLPGAILLTWRHHLTQDFLTAGNYFLAMSAGIFAGLAVARVTGRRPTAAVMAAASAIACAALLWLALVPAAAAPWFRTAGLFGVGCGAGLLNVVIFKAISPMYRHDPAATVNLAGAFFGLGSLVMAVLAGGTFYAYTAPTTLFVSALVPGYFVALYARTSLRSAPAQPAPDLQRARAAFESPAAVLFALLLFFQFGNEWSIAGWLPLFLTLRLGVSPESALAMLALYWLALLLGRIGAMPALRYVSHGKLLMGSAAAAVFGCTVLISTDNRFGAISGILLVGSGFASVYPLVVEKIGGRFPYYHPGFFNGIFSLGITGGLLAPWSLGFFTNWWGIRCVMGLPLLGTAMVFLLLIVIWFEARFGDAN